VPRFGDVFDAEDVTGPGSRFTESPAVAISLPEEEWEDEASARAVVASHLGEWVLEEQDELGRGEAVGSSVGRGAAGFAVALVFVAVNAAAGIIQVSAGMAFRRFWEKVRGSRRPDQGGFYVSRGGAAYLAAAEVGERFGEEDELVVEAIEEPSAIGGRETPELSYTGIEPWVVLLRNDKALRRYVVVVSPDGQTDGAVESPMREWEPGYLLPPERVRPPRRRPWWRFW
jgi:hypothetical protein